MTLGQHQLNAVKAAIAELSPDEITAVENLAKKLRVPLECEEHLPAALALRLVSAEQNLDRESFESLPSCECAACGMVYKHHCGSTPCCGSVAYVLTEKPEITAVPL